MRSEEEGGDVSTCWEKYQETDRLHFITSWNTATATGINLSEISEKLANCCLLIIN